MVSLRIRIFLVLFTFCLCVEVFSANLRRPRRSTEETTTSTTTKKVKEMCMQSTPCGWAVYHRYTRVIDYFMRNECDCPQDLKCIRTDDDISITAYVYRCKQHNTATDDKKDINTES